MAETGLKRRWYDLEVQKITGSIIASVIFHQIKSMIERNISDGEKAIRYKCFSHLGKPGVCITHAEIAEYICTDKSKISYAIDKLKSANLIGMDYVSIEGMRAPFFFLLESGNEAIKNQKNYNLRYYFKEVMQKVKCFNAAVIHGHIAFRNESTETKKGGPLVQSFEIIGENVGLTSYQVKIAFKNLVDNELVLTSKSQDRRYSLIAVRVDLRKNDGWSTKKPPMVSEKHTDGLRKNDDYQDSQYLHGKRGEEEPPPSFFPKKEEKKTMIRGFPSEEFSESDLATLIRLSNENHSFVDAAFTRYYRECQDLKLDRLPNGTILFHLLKFLGWCQESNGKNIAIVQQEEKSKEAERKKDKEEADAREERRNREKEEKKKEQTEKAMESFKRRQEEISKNQQAI